MSPCAQIAPCIISICSPTARKSHFSHYAHGSSQCPFFNYLKLGGVLKSVGAAAETRARGFCASPILAPSYPKRDAPSSVSHHCLSKVTCSNRLLPFHSNSRNVGRVGGCLGAGLSWVFFHFSGTTTCSTSADGLAIYADIFLGEMTKGQKGQNENKVLGTTFPHQGNHEIIIQLKIRDLLFNVTIDLKQSV